VTGGGLAAHRPSLRGEEQFLGYDAEQHSAELIDNEPYNEIVSIAWVGPRLFKSEFI
jgi:hypothetical protein